MATLSQATSYNLKGYGAVQKMDTPVTPPPQRSYPSTLYLRAPVPQIGNAAPDSQRTYYNGGSVPQTRIPILNFLGSPF